MNCPFTHLADGAAPGQPGRRSGVRGDPAVEASRGEGVSRSASEPDSASKRNSQAAMLPDWLKPDTAGEATGGCSQRAWRGGWGQRAPKD